MAKIFYFLVKLTVINVEYLYKANLILIGPNVGLVVVPINNCCTKLKEETFSNLFMYLAFINKIMETINVYKTDATI